MKTNYNYQKQMNTYKKISISNIQFIIIVLLSSLLFSCSKYGDDGYPGKAYLSLFWTGTEPAYIEVGNSDIPTKFFWTTYYRVSPGIYLLYYEVDVIENNQVVTYWFELEYEIWIDPGEPGDIDYDGKDGGDMYFDLGMTPDGPTIYGKMLYKSTPKNTLNEFNPEEMVIENKNGYCMKLTYKKGII